MLTSGAILSGAILFVICLIYVESADNSLAFLAQIALISRKYLGSNTFSVTATNSLVRYLKDYFSKMLTCLHGLVCLCSIPKRKYIGNKRNDGAFDKQRHNLLVES